MKQQEEIKMFANYPDVLGIKDLRQALGIGRAGGVQTPGGQEDPELQERKPY